MQVRTSQCLLFIFFFAALCSGCDGDPSLSEASDTDSGDDPNDQTMMVLGNISLDFDDAVLMLFNQDPYDDPESVEGLMLVVNNN
ncbi:MAG: hypothetical protein AB8B64_27475 [Granulosicoccus sp.]